MTTTLLKWKIFCTTSNQYEYVWQETSPTTCPISSGHSVDLNRVAPESNTTAITLVSYDSPYNLTKHTLLCDTTSGSITINLPPVSRSKDAIQFIQKITTANSVIINANGSDLIDGGSSKTMTSLDEKAIIFCDGTNWTSQTERANINNNTPLTIAKGDMLVDNGKELTYLPVGTNNYIMMPDSSSSSGVGWSNLLVDSVINFSNSADTSKKVKFDLSNITTATTRTITLPNTSTTLTGISSGSSTNNSVVRFDGTSGYILQNSGVLIDDNNSLTVGNDTTGTIGSAKELVLRQDGDFHGSSILRLRNRTGENGAIFETTDNSITLVDFIFKTAINQRNIRYEARSEYVHISPYTSPEFEIGPAGNPTVCINDSLMLVKGNIDVTGTVDGRNIAVDGSTQDNHISSSSGAHGVTGSIVGTTDNQTLTTKTINADNNTVTNIANAEIKADAAIDATKIANGSITNTEFQYLNEVTSSIQTQLDGKSPTSHNHSAGNITSGTLSLTRGGTGQTSKTTAFDGLAPSTTKGDLILYNGTDNIRLGVGTNDYVLIADSSEPSGVKWAAVSSGSGGDVALVQARRTTTHNITDAWTTITFDTTDVETTASVVEHDNTNTDRITILESGYYEIYYSVDGIASAGAFHDIHTRVLINGVTLLAGTETTGASYGIGHISSAAIKMVYASFTASNYVTLQVKFDNAATGTTRFDPIFRVRKLETMGPQGPAGSGSTVILKDEGSNITNTPHSSLNFVGSGVSVVDAGSGVATVTVGGGIFGSGYEFWSSLDGNSPIPFNTDSVTYVTASTFTTSSLTSGTYFVQWYCEFTNTNNEEQTNFRMYHNDIDTLSEQISVSKQDNGYSWHNGNGLTQLSSISGVQTFKFQVCRKDNNAEIRRMRCAIWRVS